MAIRAGRVGVRYDQVDVYGRITNVHPGFYEGVSAESLTNITTSDIASITDSITPYGRKVINSIKGNTIVSGNELVSFNGTGIKIVGFNQWDEEYQFGYYDGNGIFHARTTQGEIASKNMIRVFPNTAYFFHIGANVNRYVCYYDAGGNIISQSGLGGSDSAFTTPSNCHYINFNAGANYGTTYNNDICINISSNRNGEYEPYTSSTLSLPISTYFPNGMNGVNNVYDELSEVKATKRMDGYTFTGNETWSYNSSDRFWQVQLSLANFAKTVGAEISSNGILLKFVNNYYARAYLNDNPSLSDSSAMNSIFSNGTQIVYELATPTEEDVNLDLSYNTYENGTEQLLSVTDTSPLLADITSYTVGATGNDVEKLLGSIAQVETSPATSNHAVGDYIMYNYQLYKVTASITTGASLVVGTNITATTVMDEFKTL